MESSQFSDTQPRFEGMEPVDTNGATCDTYRVKLYGKLHFLKRLKPQFAGDIRYQEAFRKEFETGYRLEHPNIVRYLSLSDDGILMEYVDGETLSQRLSKHPDYFESKKNTEKFLRQLLDAVACLHSHQVLHLDLKPDNIMLTHINSDVKLIDFGCCYTDSFVDTQGHTNFFAAPEQLSGGSIDERTDIYAIGKILTLLPDHHIYNKVIARCTAESPEDRYQTIEDLQNALFPKRKNRLLALFVILVPVLALGFLFLTNKNQPSVVNIEPQQESHFEKKVFVKEVVQATQQHQVRTVVEDVVPQLPLEPATPRVTTLSEEEKSFMNQPHLHVVTAEEFVRYKELLDEYYCEINAFLDDTTNFQKFPSHISYLTRYQDIQSRTLARIEADEWFCPLYNSPMNPVSTYTRKYMSNLQHRAYVNGNKLP